MEIKTQREEVKNMIIEKLDQYLINRPSAKQSGKLIPAYGSDLDELIATWDRLSPEEREKENAKLEKIAKSSGSGGP